MTRVKRSHSVLEVEKSGWMKKGEVPKADNTVLVLWGQTKLQHFLGQCKY